ncbi:hypothetical protein [Sphingomonas hankookensis]|uniref:Uncharacterized protein n=1 Tax=Sphingomonas hengshuiensis TaxID=1609977 RepID=A0A2W5BGW8_9SPHN|nr:MAG: hypothetical protein DI632_02055 [Sphingomonas hengshuiensis]
MDAMLSSILLIIAQATAPPPAAPAEEVVVVGHRATDALAACLARQCPPAEDVEASLQASVEQFTAGRYDLAQRTLQRSIRRNRRHAAQLPGPVSSLYATLATVAEHDGYRSRWQFAARDNVGLLRRHVGVSDPGTLIEEMSLANTMLGTGDPSTAWGILKKVEIRALAAGHKDIAAGAAFRQAWLALREGNYRRAGKLADHAVDIAGSRKSQIATLRDVLNSRIALRKGDAGAIDALAARIRQTEAQRPILLFSESAEDIISGGGIIPAGLTAPGVRFADVGYWIRPDGRTASAEILNASNLGQWEKTVLKQVGTRRYASLAVPAGHPGIYRVDRFTIRATFDFYAGARYAQRMGPPTIHIVDLTDTEAMTAAQKRRVAEATAPGGI